MPKKGTPDWTARDIQLSDIEAKIQSVLTDYEIPELEHIGRIMDEERKPVHDRAKAFLGQKAKRKKIFDAMNVGDKKVSFMTGQRDDWMYAFMDASGTPEADKKNAEFFDRLSQADPAEKAKAQKALIDETIRIVMSFDEKKLEERMDNMQLIEFYEKNRMALDLAFAGDRVGELVSHMTELGYDRKLIEPFRKKCKGMEKALNSIGGTMEYFADDLYETFYTEDLTESELQKLSVSTPQMGGSSTITYIIKSVMAKAGNRERETAIARKVLGVQELFKGFKVEEIGAIEEDADKVEEYLGKLYGKKMDPERMAKLITINGQTLDARLRDMYKKSKFEDTFPIYFDTVFKEASKTLIAAAMNKGLPVCAVKLGPEGKMTGEVDSLKGSGVTKAVDIPKLNLWERLWSNFGFYKEKVAQVNTIKEGLKVSASNEMVQEIKLSGTAQDAQKQCFFKDWCVEHGEPLPSGATKRGNRFTTERGACVTLAMFIALEKGESLESVVDPFVKTELKTEAGNLAMDLIQRPDSELDMAEIGKHFYAGTQKVLAEVNKRMQSIDLTKPETLFDPKNVALLKVAGSLTDAMQEICRQDDMKSAWPEFPDTTAFERDMSALTNASLFFTTMISAKELAVDLAQGHTKDEPSRALSTLIGSDFMVQQIQQAMAANPGKSFTEVMNIAATAQVGKDPEKNFCTYNTLGASVDCLDGINSISLSGKGGKTMGDLMESDPKLCKELGLAYLSDVGRKSVHVQVHQTKKGPVHSFNLTGGVGQSFKDAMAREQAAKTAQVTAEKTVQTV